MNKIKQAALDIIINDACDLFLSRSVNDVTISDIAEKSEVGVATVYRYFSTKKNILEKCAVKLQLKVYEDYFKLTGESGYDKIKKFYYGYLEVFKAHPEFYRFINEFDAFMTMENNVRLEDYSKGLDLFSDEFNAIYREGLKDGSIKRIEDVRAFYYSTTHAMLELCKKLSANVRIVKQDENIRSDVEIGVLVDIILSALKA
ncbi:MAG: TetR/AcrR family transcriptional regulator [Clostridia bacterium]|nr:TetR/AcrR family transcriptional regulator [Clostridia bacterium]